MYNMVTLIGDITDWKCERQRFGASDAELLCYELQVLLHSTADDTCRSGPLRIHDYPPAPCMWQSIYGVFVSHNVITYYGA